jgi:hypothetical protein
MPERSLPIEQLLIILAEQPERLAALTADLTPEALRAAPRPGAWSQVDILAHMRACADVAGEAMRRIVAEDNPAFRAVNPRAWAEEAGYRAQEFRPLLQAFSRHRAELVTILRALPPEAWARAGQVKGAGPAKTRTVDFYAAWMVRHEAQHVTEVRRMVKRARRGIGVQQT